VYTRPLRLKPNAPEGFKIFKVAAENESQRRMREVMTDNARELSMGGMRQTCEQEGIKLNTSVRYSLESNGVAEHTIGVLTNAVRAMPQDSGLPQCAQQDVDTNVRRSNAVRGTLWRETGRFTFARIWSVMRHCRAEGTVEEA